MTNKAGSQEFEVLEEQTNSDEAKEIERQWKKKVQKEKDGCYTKLMIIAIAVMVLIFIILISFLSEDKKKHVELQQISYNNTNYVYLQSSLPHLKFLYPKDESTLQIKTLKGVGIIYSEFIAWIETNVQPNMKILFIPNQNSGVNVLGITLGYYLNLRKGGSLDVVVSKIKFQEMTIKNLEQMDKERPQGQKIPMNLLSGEAKLDYSKYSLIVTENNNEFKKISSAQNAQNAKILIVKSKIQKDWFPDHKPMAIVSGKTTSEVRQFDIKYGYAIVPYDSNRQNILLLPKTILDIEECQQKKSGLMNQQTALRNMAIYLRNKTFAQSTIYYGLQNSVALELIAQIPTVSRLYSKNEANLPNVISIKNKDIQNVQQNPQISLSQTNYYIIDYNPSITYTINQKDIFLLLLQNYQQTNNLLKQYPDQNMMMMSPYNNKGCFYPPACSSFRKVQPFLQFFVILRSSK